MHIDTKVATIGTYETETPQRIVSLPPYRASTILFDTLADFDKVERGEWPFPTYGRYGTPSTSALEHAIAELEGADHAILHASGMAAIATALIAFVKAGDHLLMVDTVYGPSRRFCEYELKRLGVEITYYDPAIGSGIAALMKENTRVVYCESPGSLTFEMQDIPAIANEAHKRGIIVVADNTWATPILFKAFEHGVDISMQSLTKYVSGHSDLVMGSLSCKKEHYKRLLVAARNLGAAVSADNCYLAMRGMRTMAVRLKQHQENALVVANWLRQRPEVVKLLYPALLDDPGHALWKRDMLGATALFGILLKPCPREALAAMLDNVRYFHMGYSWGGFESLLIPFNLDKVRTATRLNHDGHCLRIHIGLENPADLIADLESGFERMRNYKS